MKFEKLLEPALIGKMEVKNRTISAPFESGYAARDGSVTPRLCRYYKEKARGGVGLVITETSYIDSEASRASWCQLGAYDDGCIRSLATLAQTIIDQGSKACLQICHAGARKYVGTYPMVSPSGVQLVKPGVVPEVLDVEGMQEIVQAFGAAALRAKQAGFNMVEIHCGHGYLISNFLSSYTNRRSDSYGGKLKNRMRFPLEAIACVRASVGKSFPLSARISAVEYLEKGITLHESKLFATEIEKSGIDLIHVSAGSHDSVDRQTEPMLYPCGAKVGLAKAIKKTVGIPIVASGSINTPELAESILRKRYADFVSMARPLLADQDFVRKIEEGRSEDIRPCIRCCEGCHGRGSAMNRPASCSVNVTLGMEGEYEIEPALKPKEVMVVGGGPGGMEAARVAALRGHNVTLYEKRSELGGHLIEGSVPEFKKDLRIFIQYLSTQLIKLGVEIELDKKITAAAVLAIKPDAVVLATGSVPIVPKIAGIDQPHVASAIDVLMGEAAVGDSVIVAGGGNVGCEIALFLAMKGKRVTIVEMLPEIAIDVEWINKLALTRMLAREGVNCITNCRVEEITEDGIIASEKNCQRRAFKADNIVLALGFQPDNELCKAIGGKIQKIYTVGDCVSARKIHDAIHEGYMAGLSI